MTNGSAAVVKPGCFLPIKQKEAKLRRFAPQESWFASLTAAEPGNKEQGATAHN